MATARVEREDNRFLRLRQEAEDVAASKLRRSRVRPVGWGIKRWHFGAKDEEERERGDREVRENLRAEERKRNALQARGEHVRERSRAALSMDNPRGKLNESVKEGDGMGCLGVSIGREKYLLCSVSREGVKDGDSGLESSKMVNSCPRKPLMLVLFV